MTTVHTRPVAPATYLNVAVPPEIAEQWNRWEGAAWRRMRHMGTNDLYPPDMRFGVSSPAGMCPVHLEIRRKWRDMHFDPVSGNRWPGHPGSPFIIIGPDLNRVREERRCEWDLKASEAMQLTEEICLSGRSPQCAPQSLAPQAKGPASPGPIVPERTLS